MDGQAAELQRLLADSSPTDAAAERLRGRRVVLIGTGTSWHAANVGAWFLRAAGVDAWAIQGVDAALHGPRPTGHDGVILLSHRGTKRYTTAALTDAREAGAAIVTISGRGVPGADIETVDAERSSAFTTSHTAAMLRVAQIATALGAELGPLEAVPETVDAVLSSGETGIKPPTRLLEFCWRRAEPVDRRRGCSEGPRDVLRRHPRAFCRAAAARPDRGPRSPGHARLSQRRGAR